MTRRRVAIALATMRAGGVPAIKALTLVLLSGLITVGCATGRPQSGNLARVIAQQLKEYGAELPHINLQLPAIGIDQMYTSWRWEGDPGGFILTFQDGAFNGVLYPMKQIAGEPQATSDAAVHRHGGETNHTERSGASAMIKYSATSDGASVSSNEPIPA